MFIEIYTLLCLAFWAAQGSSSSKFQTNIDAQYMNQYRACISLWVIKLTVRAKFLFLKVSQLKLKAAAGKHIRTFLFQKQINIYFLSNLHSFMVWEYSKMYVNCRYNLKASMWKWKDYLLFCWLSLDLKKTNDCGRDIRKGHGSLINEFSLMMVILPNFTNLFSS